MIIIDKGDLVKAAVSRYIREAVEEGKIKPFDEEASKRLMKYAPFWEKL